MTSVPIQGIFEPSWLNSVESTATVGASVCEKITWGLSEITWATVFVYDDWSAVMM